MDKRDRFLRDLQTELRYLPICVLVWIVLVAALAYQSKGDPARLIFLLPMVLLLPPIVRYLRLLNSCTAFGDNVDAQPAKAELVLRHSWLIDDLLLKVKSVEQHATILSWSRGHSLQEIVTAPGGADVYKCSGENRLAVVETTKGFLLIQYKPEKSQPVSCL